jgi:hypothetical protein
MAIDLQWARLRRVQKFRQGCPNSAASVFGRRTAKDALKPLGGQIFGQGVRFEQIAPASTWPPFHWKANREPVTLPTALRAVYPFKG